MKHSLEHRRCVFPRRLGNDLYSRNENKKGTKKAKQKTCCHLTAVITQKLLTSKQLEGPFKGKILH